MALELHTIRFVVPVARVEMLAGASGCIVANADASEPYVYALVLIESTLLSDVKDHLLSLGWDYVDTGDQRPAAVASWTPPDTSQAYEGLEILGVGLAASVTHANDLRTKLGSAVARIQALESAFATRGMMGGS